MERWRYSSFFIIIFQKIDDEAWENILGIGEPVIDILYIAGFQKPSYLSV